MRIAQIVALVVLAAVYVLAIPCIWLGLGPELGFVEFFLQAKSVLPLAGIAGALAALLAYIMGWNPSQAALQWIRRRAVVPLMISRGGLLLVIVLSSLALSAGAGFLISFGGKPYPDIMDLVWGENFEGADRAMAQADLPPAALADLLIINDAIRQDTLATSQAQDKSLCRIYHDYLKKRTRIFRAVWWRYVYAYSRGSCLRALEDPGGAVAEFQLARRLARWISAHEERRSARRIASIHFYDHSGSAGISKKEDRLRYIVSLLATDPDETAQRMLGSSYFQLGEYAKAVGTWRDSLAGVPKEDALERKKLLNNIALGYAAQNQPTLAAKTTQEALSLGYDENNENERREQIRLLATHTWSLVQSKRCGEASDAWDRRESLKQQARSKCSALLEAQVLACVASRDPSNSNRSAVLSAVLFGVGQSPDSFVDHTPQALGSLLDQADLTFRDCYLGLQFPKQFIANSLPEDGG